MAEGEAPKRTGLGFWKLSLGVATGTVLAGIVLMAIRHMVVIIRTKYNKPGDGGEDKAGN